MVNEKDKLNYFVALPGESMSSSCNQFTILIINSANLYMNDELLKEYFYCEQYENSKEVLNTIVGGFYGECTFKKSGEKYKKISRNDKA